MKSTPKIKLILVAVTAVNFSQATAAIAATSATVSQEQEAARLAKQLKPINDATWSTVASAKATDRYTVTKGDTLYDLSKKLFNDSKYWPKLWAVNNGNILNPHLLKPGMTITFSSGTATQLPEVSVNDPNALITRSGSATKNSTASAATAMASAGETKSDASGSSEASPSVSGDSGDTPKKRSEEWKTLPVQSWESTNLKLPAGVDRDGFDGRNARFKIARKTGFEIEAIAATDRLAHLGRIIGSRTEASFLSIGDTVYIEADEEIKIGETYVITNDPQKLKSRKSDRTGYSYNILGQVRILGVRDNLYIGTIISGKDVSFRGAVLIKNQLRIPQMDAIAGPESIEGVLMLNKTISTYATAQHKLVFIDKGSDDKVRPGMVFRAYQHYDPGNDKKLTNADFIIAADIQVVQVSEMFSSGIVIRTMMPITENTSVVLLTDVADLKSNKGFRDRSPEDRRKDQELDDLDKLDGGAALKKDEQKELKQLEQWKQNPGEAPAAPGVPAGETKGSETKVDDTKGTQKPEPKSDSNSDAALDSLAPPSGDSPSPAATPPAAATPPETAPPSGAGTESLAPPPSAPASSEAVPPAPAAPATETAPPAPATPTPGTPPPGAEDLAPPSN